MILAVDIAPALTNGDKGLSPCSSNAITELKGNPVGLAPIFYRVASTPKSSKANAKVHIFEIDSTAKRYCESSTVMISPCTVIIDNTES
ncbi:hypothetical protein M2263_004130 [Providencia alcalifaciens]|nr:hypothetical protein [Providencia alcalifaciens]